MMTTMLIDPRALGLPRWRWAWSGSRSSSCTGVDPRPHLRRPWYYFQIGRNIADGVGSTFDGTHVTNGYHPLDARRGGRLPVGFDDLVAGRSSLLALWVVSLLLVAGVIARAIDDWPLLRPGHTGRPRSRRNLLLAVVWFEIGANPYVLKLFVSGMETGVAALIGVGLLALATRTDGDPSAGRCSPPALAACCSSPARTPPSIAALFAWSASCAGASIDALVAAGAVTGRRRGVPRLEPGPGRPPDAGERGHQAHRPRRRCILTILLLVLAAAAILLAGIRLRCATGAATSRFPGAGVVAATAWWLRHLALLAYEWGFTTEIYFWHYAPQILWLLATIPHASPTSTRAHHRARRRRPRRRPPVLDGRRHPGRAVRRRRRSGRPPSSPTPSCGPAAARRRLRRRVGGLEPLPDDAVVGSFDAGVFGYFATGRW